MIKLLEMIFSNKFILFWTNSLFKQKMEATYVGTVGNPQIK